MPFESTGPHYCTVCPGRYRKDKHGKPVRTGVELELTDSNYSGTGTDIANCPVCGNGFSIAYSADVPDLLSDTWKVEVEPEAR